jgi:hypothetical protein
MNEILSGKSDFATRINMVSEPVLGPFIRKAAPLPINPGLTTLCDVDAAYEMLATNARQYAEDQVVVFCQI